MKVTIDLSEFLDEIRKMIKEELANCSNPSITPIQSKPITTKELCKHLGVTEPTILRWRLKKKIPFYKIGSAIRFDLEKVIKALEKK